MQPARVGALPSLAVPSAGSSAQARRCRACDGIASSLQLQLVCVPRDLEIPKHELSGECLQPAERSRET